VSSAIRAAVPIAGALLADAVDPFDAAAAVELFVAGHATLTDGRVTLAGLVGRPDASEMIRETVTGTPGDAAALGTELAKRLLARGADRILRELET